MKSLLSSLYLSVFLGFSSFASAFVEEVRWLEDNQHYDLVLNPQTIPLLTGYTFETYLEGAQERLVISDLRDGLWRVNQNMEFYQTTGPDSSLANLPGDQHTLSFDRAQNILIEGLDIYAHQVEEALKFSGCANVVVRDCRMIAHRFSEDAVDIVRGQNYLFDRVWFLGLGERELTVKGSARYVDIVDSQFGLQHTTDFLAVFHSTEVTIGDRTYQMGNKLIPRRTIPNWAWFCQIFSSDRALAVELGGWSDYDVGFLNGNSQLEERPTTAEIRVSAGYTDSMDDECDSGKLVPILQWHTVEQVQANAWIYNPTHSSLFGDLVEDLYYETSRPSMAREVEIRQQLGSELDYYGIELPRYAVAPGHYSNTRFFGALYNHDNQFLFSPSMGWFYLIDPPALVDHEFMKPGTWFYHYTAQSWFLLLQGRNIPNALWWNATNGNYYSGALQ